MTDESLDRARALVERAEGLQRQHSLREPAHDIWEADGVAADAVSVLGDAETPDALELRARATMVRAKVAERYGETDVARDRYRKAAELGEVADSPRGLEAAAEAWDVLPRLAEERHDSDAGLEASRRCVAAGRRAGTDVGRSLSYHAATRLASNLRGRDRPDEAVNALEAALELGTDVDGVWAESLAETALVLGRVEKETGEDRAAENAWEQAVELGWAPDTGDGPVHAAVLASVELGAARARRGDTDAAREALRQVVDLELTDITGGSFVDDVTYEVSTKRETLALAGLQLVRLAESTGDEEAVGRARELARRHLEALEDEEPAGVDETFQRRVEHELGRSIDELLTRGNGGAGP